uniref:Uncharacterized protein n=1 Tax=uncultured marine microorganism TaxID=415540 RepID=A5CFX0_9ZZZZ|nr:hypothetical protein [uncultured marine microorganism]
MRNFRVNWQQAATEFVVIVLGVLAALAVDEWRNEREDRTTESEYLARIRADIQSDIDNFKRLERTFQIKVSTITDLKDHPAPNLFSRDQTKLIDGLIRSVYVALPDSRSTTFDELTSTGRLALIENVEHRDALSQYYSGFEHISAILFEPVGDYKRILYETFQPELLMRSRSMSDLGEITDFRSNLESFLAHPEFLPAANAEIVYGDSLLYYLEQYRNQAEQILDLLNAQQLKDQ